MEFVGIAIVGLVVLAGIGVSLLLRQEDTEIRKIVQDLADLDKDNAGRALRRSAPDVVLGLLSDRAKKALENA